MSLPQVRSKAGDRAGLSDVLGPCCGSDYFYQGKSPGSLFAMVSSNTRAKGTQLHVYRLGISVNTG